ncbi:hypothetical protein C8F01DRAFT_1266772 [Mycena amicta]|nr:hypothetical protein C8F01DRAFT_1266772 [Mycena amicta]
MHPALDLKELEKLPLQLRIPARALSQFDVSTADQQTAYNFGFITRVPEREEIRVHMLPLYWTLLDPARIPSADDLLVQRDLLFQSVLSALAGISAGPHYIRDATPEIEAVLFPYREIWERVWLWIQFIVENHAILPSVCRTRGVEKLLLVRFLQLSSVIFRKDPHTVRNKPGVLVVLFRGLKLALRDEKQHVPVFTTVLLPEKFTTDQVNDIVAGSGGTMDSVAVVFTHFFSYCAKRLDGAPHHHRTQDRDLIKLVIETITAINMALAPVDGLYNFANPGPFYEVLIPRLCTRTLAGILREWADMASIENPNFNKDDLLQWERALSALIGLMTIATVSSRASLNSALRHKMLLSLINCCNRPVSAQIGDAITALLKEVLQPCSLLSSTNALLLTALRDAELHGLTPSPQVRSLPFFPEWLKLSQMTAVHNVGLLRPSSPALSEPVAACDNPHCGLIDRRTVFGKCPGCESRRYCSKACQRADWREGNHRETCAMYREARESSLQVFSASELRGIRNILHKYYTGTYQSDFYFDSVLMELRHGQVAFVVADFSEWDESRASTPNFRTYSSTDSAAHDMICASVPTWDDWVARAQRSNGLLKLHLVKFLLGGEVHVLVMPLRTNSAFLRDEAARLVSSCDTTDEDVVSAKGKFHDVWSNMQSPRGLVHFHSTI